MEGEGERKGAQGRKGREGRSSMSSNLSSGRAAMVDHAGKRVTAVKRDGLDGGEGAAVLDGDLAGQGEGEEGEEGEVEHPRRW